MGRLDFKLHTQWTNQDQDQDQGMGVRETCTKGSVKKGPGSTSSRHEAVNGWVDRKHNARGEKMAVTAATLCQPRQT